jgi:hypothetical protein
MDHQYKSDCYECPACFFKFTKSEIVEYNDKWIKCPSPDCVVVFIPRAKDMRITLINLLKKYKTCGFYHGRLTTFCPQCERDYVTECVPHTDQFSLCPSCYFPNPHSDYVRDEIYRYFNGGINTRVCEDCGNRYDSTQYLILDTESKYPYSPVLGDECYVCRECLANHPTYIKSMVCYDCYYHYKVKNCKHIYGLGEPCRLTKLEDYPTTELCDALHQFTMSYLPVAEYKFIDTKKKDTISS